MTTKVPFLKMHGAGNDFVVLDARVAQFPALVGLDVAKLAHRQLGIGCDQLIWLEPSATADVRMRILNSDGSEVGACGNATRCVGWLLMEQLGRASVAIETRAGVLFAERDAADRVRVDMGAPRLEWHEIPLAHAVDTLALPVLHPDLPAPVAISMGNPHAVFFVPDAAAVSLERYGSLLEHHGMFPERANISFATVMAPDRIQLRVWERGTGPTLACGTAACATLVAAVRRGLIAGRAAEIELPGGILPVRWDETDGHVWMGGPVAIAFTGIFRLEDYSRSSIPAA